MSEAKSILKLETENKNIKLFLDSLGRTVLLLFSRIHALEEELSTLRKNTSIQNYEQTSANLDKINHDFRLENMKMNDDNKLLIDAREGVQKRNTALVEENDRLRAACQDSHFWTRANELRAQDVQRAIDIMCTVKLMLSLEESKCS